MENIDFIQGFFLNEVRGYKREVDYNALFDNLELEIKNDLLLESKRLLSIFTDSDSDYGEFENVINISYFFESIKEISGINIDIEFYYIRVNEDDKSKTKIGFNVFLKDSVNFVMQGLYFSEYDIDDLLMNYIYNILFYIYIFVHFFKYDSMFNNFYHEDDIIKMKEIKNRMIRLFGTDHECCVCLEKTSLKTFCNHMLCNRCYYKLKTKVCPLCRTVLETDMTGNEDNLMFYVQQPPPLM